jgi:hypothetical protein
MIPACGNASRWRYALSPSGKLLFKIPTIYDKKLVLAFIYVVSFINLK